MFFSVHSHAIFFCSSSLDLVPLHLPLPYCCSPLQAAAKRVGVELRVYTVIYNLVDDVRAAMEGRLKSSECVRGGGEEVVIGWGVHRVC